MTYVSPLGLLVGGRVRNTNTEAKRMNEYAVYMSDFEGGSRVVSNHVTKQEADFAAQQFANEDHEQQSVWVEDLREV